MLQRTLLKFKKSKERSCSVRLATTRSVVNFIAPSPGVRPTLSHGERAGVKEQPQQSVAQANLLMSPCLD